MALIEDAGRILNGATDLLKNPVVGSAVSGVLSWVKSKLTSKSQKERLATIEKNEHDEKTIIALMAQLEVLLEENDALAKELDTKVAEVKKALEDDGKQDGLTQYNYTMSVKGDGNISIQGMNASGDINIGK